MQHPVLLTTAYFAPIHYYTVLANYPVIYIEQYEHYSRQTFRNRTQIFSANGLLNLSIPVIKKNPKTYTKDIIIDNSNRWKAIHKRAIESAYRSSPFFIYYADEIFECYNQPIETLLQFNLYCQNIVFELIGIKPEIKLTASFKNVPQNTIDFSEAFQLKNNSDCSLSKPYFQVFETKFGFLPNLGILDLLFNLGPASEAFLKNNFPFNK